MSNGATTGSKQEHHSTARKRKAAELDALLSEHGVGSVEELKAQLAGLAEPLIARVDSVYVAPEIEEANPPTITEPTPDVVIDPLAWITKKTKIVFMVSGTSLFTLRPENPRSNPPERSVDQLSDQASPWHSNPYDYRKANRTQEENLKIMHANWWHHMVLAETARRWDQDDRYERPEEAVIASTDFTGWNSEVREPNGRLSPITEYIPLRELVRGLLQKNTKTFLDWGRHRGMFNPATPNPYHHSLPNVGSTVLPIVSNWTKDLDAAK